VNIDCSIIHRTPAGARLVLMDHAVLHGAALRPGELVELPGDLVYEVEEVRWLLLEGDEEDVPVAKVFVREPDEEAQE